MISNENVIWDQFLIFNNSEQISAQKTKYHIQKSEKFEQNNALKYRIIRIEILYW